MGHFNGLQPDEAERLAILVEECGEVVQVIGKILRHGYESQHPQGGPTNRGLLEKELGHVRHAMIWMCETGDLSKGAIHQHADDKKAKINLYLHHQSR